MIRTGLYIGVFLWALTGCDGGDSGATSTLPPSPDQVVADPLCLSDSSDINWQALAEVDCPHLSQYNLFWDQRNPRTFPSAPGLEFSPASALFSDYANKYRFMYLPPGTSATYRDRYGLTFPVGTVMVKTFALPISNTSGDDRLIETRLLIHRASGWVGLPYQWQENGDDATLVRAGSAMDTFVIVDGVQYDFRYQIPDVLTCRKCHQGRTENDVMSPLGTTVRQLNHQRGDTNQLVQWQTNGLLTSAPAQENWPKAVNWKNADEPLAQRAQSYLDINCSHCHSDIGSGALSGLRLEMWRDPNSYQYGVCNRAQGYYGGPLGLTFDIVPGDSAKSVIPFRLNADRFNHTAKDVMPPLGRSLADHDAATLIRQWIDGMPANNCASIP